MNLNASFYMPYFLGRMEGKDFRRLGIFNGIMHKRNKDLC